MEMLPGKESYMSNVRVVDVIIRKTAEKTALRGEGNISVSVSAPSVIEIHAAAQDVDRYVRQGKDLLIYMKDGSVIRCSNYFVEDPQDKQHSELVFNDQQQLTHITFAEAGDTAALASAELTPQATPIASIQPFLEQGDSLSDAPWGWIAGAALGGGAIGALLANDNGGGHKTRTEVIDNTREVESAKPTFMVSDKQGDKQGVLSAKEITDDKNPTFSGTGQPGSTIQIKDSGGNTIASTMVDKNGNWTVKLPTQSDGEHTWSVVQIDGSKTTPAGDITIVVATADAAITLAATTGDNIINAAEQAKGFAISGSAANLAEGTILTVTLNGKSYAATVGGDGKWSVNLSAGDAKLLGDGSWTVAVTGKDAAGNTVTGSQTLNVDTHPPIVSVDAVTKDNIINAAEHGGALTLTGKTTADPGQTITVTLNGKTYTTAAGSDGSWSLALSAGDVKALGDGGHNIKVSVSDKAGNVGTGSADFIVDTAAPSVTVDTIATDNVINSAEHGQVLIVTGSAAGGQAGDLVVVTLNGKQYTTVLDAGGKWTVGVPTADVGSLADGNHSVTVTVTDRAGNVGSGERSVEVATAAPTLGINTIAGDDVINAAEKGADLILTGTSNQPEGTQIVVTLNGKSYTAEADADGAWSVTVPATDVSALDDARYSVTASVTDRVGNGGSAAHEVLLDSALPGVSINAIASDNVINAEELKVDQILSGSAVNAAEGDTVSVNVGGHSFTTTVQPDLSWSVALPADVLAQLGNGSLTAVVTVTNGHGNVGSAERGFTIDANLPGLRVDTLAGDDVINSLERGQDLVVSGSSDRLPAGTAVTVTIGGKDYQATVDASGGWRAVVPKEDVGSWDEGQVTLSVSATTPAGNAVAIEHGVSVDLSEVSVSINPVTGDNVLNAAEKGQDLVLSGATANVEAGREVTVTFGGRDYQAAVDAEGNWTLTVPAADLAGLKEGDASVQASVSNHSGNQGESSWSFSVDTVAPTLTIDPVSGDNILNAAEAGAPLTISGTSSAEAGQQITVTFNHKEYTATVDDGGRWTLDVPAADMAGIANGDSPISAAVADKAGNPAAADTSVLVNTVVPQITFDTIAHDNVLNASEQEHAQIISGRADGAAAGDVVKVVLGDTTYTSIVQEDGCWSVGLPPSACQALGEGCHTITVTVVDAAGNVGTGSHEITLSGVPPVFTVDAISGDNVLNAQEAMQPLLLKGTSGLPDGSAVTVTFNNVEYAASVENGQWSVLVPVTDVLKLDNTLYTVTVSGSDAVGNAGSASGQLLVDTALPRVIISTFAGDDLVNKAETDESQLLSGRVIGASAGDEVAITLGGKNYTATVDDNLSWRVSVSPEDLQALGDGDLTIVASVTNAHGNTGSAERDININAGLPGLRINLVSGDDVVNALEQQQDLVISGTATNLAEGSVVIVTVNGVEHQAVTNAEGQWQIGISADELQHWSEGDVAIGARTEDAWGNAVSADHTVTLDLNAVAIAIDIVSGDNTINAAEKGQDLILSGTTHGVEAGQTVVVKFADGTYTCEVQEGGTWTLTVPAGDMDSLIDGRAQIVVSVTNASGNSADAGQTIIVDTLPPTLTIDNLTDDNIISVADAQQDLVVSGTSSAEAGQKVTVTVNGRDYEGKVQVDGSWQVTLPQADVADLADGNFTVTATVSDAAGNASASERTGLVDATSPQVTINDFVTATNTLNHDAHQQAQVLTGSVTGAEPGDKIVVVIGGVSYDSVVDAAGNWSLGLPASVIKDLAEGDGNISVTVTDRAGNTGTGSLNFTVNTAAPEIAINTLAGDDVINAVEKGAELVLTGTSNQPAGTQVTVTLNGKNYLATADADGSWRVSVPADDVIALGETRYSITAGVTDSIGNSASAAHDVLVDSALPGVTIDPITADDVINAAEAEAGQTISGSVSNAEEGNVVTVTINGTSRTTQVQEGGRWSIDLDQGDLEAFGDGPLTVTATVTNGHGNTGSGERNFAIDADFPSLRFDTIAGDNVINRAEHAQDLVVSGSSGGLKPGSAVTVTINGKAYAATVLEDGSWSAAVPKADVGAWSDGPLTVTVSGTSEAGNPMSQDRVIDVDLSEVSVSIDSITADNVISAAEKAAGITLSGGTTHVEQGQKVTITLGTKTWTATVDEHGRWTLSLTADDLTGLAEGSAVLQASVTSINGNAASSGRDFTVDTMSPTLTIDPVNGDSLLNAQEAGKPLTIGGASSAEAGQQVTVTFNGHDYTTTVGADGRWSLEVPAADMVGIADGRADITARVSDRAGNPTSAESAVLVDTTVPEITISTIAGDDVINSAEHGQALMVTGNAKGAAAGDTLTVTLNGKTYTTTLDADGNWSVGIPAGDVKALAADDYTITATVTDRAGNVGSGSHDVIVNLSGPTLTIDTLGGDGVINGSEKGQDLIVTGTATGMADGAQVTVTINGRDYQGTVDGLGNWTATVPAADVGRLGNASYDVSVSATDARGNSGAAAGSVLIDTAKPGVIINTIASDDVINRAESEAGQTITGRVINAEPGNMVTVTINGKHYDAVVQADGSWSADVPAADLQAIGNGPLSVTATVTNDHGNTGESERPFAVDVSAPTIAVDALAGDDIINRIEHGQDLIVTGTSEGLAQGATVIVVIGGKNYDTVVKADGTWTTTVSDTDVSLWADGPVKVEVSSESAVGNPVSGERVLTVDLAEVSISIDKIAGDDVLNAAEKGADLILSGRTTNVAEGRDVTITFGDKTYTATVGADGRWSYPVPKADLADLIDGKAHIDVSVENGSGNEGRAGRDFIVDGAAPTLSLNVVSTDNMLNATEAGQPLIISGTSSAEAGCTVNVTFNGKDYTATVGADGRWSLEVPPSGMLGLTDGSVDITATVSDKAGNSTSSSTTVLVDLTVPEVTINTVSGDDVINAAEHGQALMVTGSVTGAQPGDVVTVTLNDKTYTATLDADGNWSVGIPAGDVKALAQDDYTITASVTDRAGNNGSAGHDITVNLTAPVLTVDVLSGDGVINATEHGRDLTITGTAPDMADGAQVTVTINGKNYQGSVDAEGKWTATVPAADVGNLGNARYDVSVSGTDARGNTGSAAGSVLVDTAKPGVIINTVAGDDVINRAESEAGQTITGRVVNAEPGNKVTVTINDKPYDAVVQPDSSWSVKIPAADLQAIDNGQLSVTATVTNGRGNTGGSERPVTVDVSAPTIGVDTVAGDDILNRAEHAQDLIVTGTSEGLAQGETVIVVIEGKNYNTVVQADGSWMTKVPAADVGSWADGTVKVEVSAQSSAGNPVSGEREFEVDLAEVSVSINAVTEDNVLNAAEKGEDLILSGSTTHVEAGREVIITLGDKTYRATVDGDGEWSYPVPKADLANLIDGKIHIELSVENASGNAGGAGHDFILDATAPTLAIDAVSTDNMISAAEAGQPLTISGTSSAEAGCKVTVQFNNHDYSATVDADGRWTLDVPAADMTGIANGNADITASVSDKAGNPASATTSVLVDTVVPEVTITDVSSGKVINCTEHGQALIVTGSVTGAQPGDAVTVTLNDKTYTATLDAAGNWSIGVPASDVGLLGEKIHTVTAAVTDRAGNSGSGSYDVTVNLTAPVLTIDTLSGDDVINSSEKGKDLLISGTVDGMADDAQVTVTLNGKEYQGSVSGGKWTATVPADDVTALGEAHYRVDVSAADVNGNRGSAARDLQVDSQLPAVAIDPIAGDDVINAAEAAAGQTLSGRVINAEAGDTVTVVIGGKSYTAEVQPDLSWSLALPKEVLEALGNGPLTATATVTNGHGNTGGGERDFTVDANLPGLRIDTVAGDNVINSIEHAQCLIVTGGSDGLKAGSAVTVTINGRDYRATVLEDGSWSAAVPKADVGAWGEGPLKVTVAGTSAAGNPMSQDRIVTVDLAEVAISINDVTADNVLSAAEKNADIILSGTTSGVEAGQTVNVVFAGKTWTTEVNADLSWSLQVEAKDLQGLQDGGNAIQVTVKNVNGNSASADHEYRVDTVAPTVTIDTLAKDNVLNVDEAKADLTISGTSTAEAGQTVTVTLNDKDYTATVGADGRWTLSVPPADLGAMADGDNRVSAVVTDRAGNAGNVSGNLTVDLTVPKVEIDAIAGDDVINLTEHGQAQIISGSASGAAVGDKVTVTIGSQSWTTVLDANLAWSLGLPAGVVQALSDGKKQVEVSITDAAGNTGSASRELTVDTGLPSITLNAIAEDNVLNAVEKGQDLVIGGSSANLGGGREVTVTLNGKSYTSKTDADGNWTLTVKAADLAALGEANYTVSASASNAHGNSISARANLQVDTALPSVVINAIAGDDVINAAEAEAGQTLTGRVFNAEAGNRIDIIIGGKHYSAEVQPDLSWSLQLPKEVLEALGNGALTATASVTNGHGNTGGGERGFVIDASLPGLRVDTVAGDDVINSIEHGQDLIVTGGSDGLQAGSAVTVIINGKDYPATVLADGSWSAAVPKEDVGAWSNGELTISVSGTSAAGNPIDINHVVNVDLNPVAISVNDLTADNVISAAEKAEGITLTGSTSGVEEGQAVTVVIGGISHQTDVKADGSWSLNLAAQDLAGLKDGDASVQVSVSNQHGNSISAGRDFSVDTLAPTVTIAAIAGDDVLNAAEAKESLTVSGTTTAEAGQSVTVKINGHEHTAEVGADGRWSLSVPAADLAGLTDGTAKITATVEDRAGNSGAGERTLAVDLTPPTVTINDIAGDNIINTTEHTQAQIVSGSATGAAPGDRVTLIVGEHTYVTILDANSNWSIGLPAGVVQGLKEGDATFKVSITDAAGNTGEESRTVTVNSEAVSLTFNPIAGDNVLNAVEKGEDLAISGSSANLGANKKVTVTLNGHDYETTTDINGNWTLTVAAADLAALGEANYTLSASAANEKGNSASGYANLQVDTALPYVIINTIAGDNVVNAAEVATGQTISGKVINAQPGNTVNIEIGGHAYTATVKPDLSWSIEVPQGDLQAMGNGPLAVTATVTNKHGNTGGGERDFAIDASLPGLRVDTVAGDNVINSIERGQDLIVSGGSDGLKAGSAVTVTINGKEYAATVLADGSWHAPVPAADVGSWPEGKVAISVRGTSETGNPMEIGHIVTVDLAKVAITIDSVTADNVLNAKELGEGITLTGSTSNVEAGQKVTVVIGGKSYETSVDAGGRWSLDLTPENLAGLKDGDADIQASVKNVNGNGASAGREYSVDATAPTVTIDMLADDGVLNAEEVKEVLTVSGTTTAEAGQTVTVTLGGKEYTATAGADGRWSLDVPAADLAGLSDGDIKVSATVSDSAGNSGAAERTLTVDTTAPDVFINKVAGDDIINIVEQGQAQIVSGSATGAAAGDKVTIRIDGKTYTTVLDADLNWSIGLPASVVSALSEGEVTIDVSVTDAAGNTGHGSRDILVNSDVSTLKFDDIAGDNVLNAIEKGQDLVISGSSTDLAKDTDVAVVLNGKTYAAKIDADGNWTLTIPAADLAGLGEANYVLSASATNSIGNAVSGSASLQVDTSLPYVVINSIAGDDVINAAEAAAGQTISGKVVNAAVGDTVTVEVGGHSYTAQVQPGLSWSVNVTPEVLEDLGDGALTVTATVTNGRGNTGGGERDFAIDANIPGLRVDTVAGDNVINRAERGQDLIITGTSDGIAPGAVVTVTINGKDYAATVLADGSWRAPVPAADLGNLPAGKVQIGVSGTSAAGNDVHIDHKVTVDLADVSVSINPITADNVINAAEKAQGVTLTGSTTNVEEGQVVTVTIGGKSHAAVVDGNGSWSLTLAADDVAMLQDGGAVVQASVRNASGNDAAAAREFSVDTAAPVVIIDAIAADNVINGSEVASGFTLSGSTSAEAGQTVTITLGDKTWTAQVEADGRWQVAVGADELKGMADKDYAVQVSVSDAAGNGGSASVGVVLDTAPPTITFDKVAGDNIINSVEHGQAQIVSGTAEGAQAGDRLTVTIGNDTFVTTVDAGGKWLVGVPASVISALANGTVTFSATVTDKAGNSSSMTHDVEVNTASVSLNIGTIAGDDVINALEASGDLLVTGTSAQFANGTQVTVMLNGKSYEGTIVGDSWQVKVPAAELAQMGDGRYQVSVHAEDAAGNSAGYVREITVDVTAPVISIATISTDDVLNAAEQQQPLTVRGATSAEAGQTVTVKVGDYTGTATVNGDGSWSLVVPADSLAALGEGALEVTASVSDKAGNDTTGSRTLTVDTAPPTVTIDAVTADNIINSVEQQAGQAISGSTTAEEGQTVTVTFNGHDYLATVGADGKWSVFVPGRDFLGLSDGDYGITVKVSDKAGNPGEKSQNVTLSGDTPVITIDTFAQDDIVSLAERAAPLVISGTTDAPVGQTVTVTLNGKTYTAKVLDGGLWACTVGAADAALLVDGGAYDIRAEVSNAIGNTGSGDRGITVDLTPPSMSISIDSLLHDTGLSASDFITSNGNVTLNGSLTAQLGSGEKAQISLDGGTTWIDLIVSGTSWSFAEASALAEGEHQYQVRVIDAAGNVGATDEQIVVVDQTKPAVDSITVDSITSDTGLSASDFITSDRQIALQGKLGAELGEGDHAQISIDGGKTWVDVDVSGTAWTWVDGRTLADGKYNYQLRVIDDAGNVSAVADKVVTIDTVAPDNSKTIEFTGISDDTGRSGSDYITSDTTLTLNGKLGATLADGEYVQFSLDDGLTWDKAVVVGDTWHFTDSRTLADGTYDYRVRVIDAAGNEGKTAKTQVTIDTHAPTVQLTVDKITVDTGASSSDFLTSETSYTLHGTTSAPLAQGEFVQVSVDNGATWHDAVLNGSAWSYADGRTLTDGVHGYQVRVVDLAGNVGATTSQNVTVDTKAPEYGIAITTISEDTGSSATDFVTMDNTLTISGTLNHVLAADEHAQISLDGGKTWINVTVSDKVWSYEDTRVLADGDHTYMVRVLDDAGNTSATASQVVTVDTTAPDTLGQVVGYADDQGERQGANLSADFATDDTAPVINGSLNQPLADGEVAELYRDGKLLGKVTMNGNTSWVFNDSGLTDGNHIYIVRVTDKAGNYVESEDWVLKVDTSKPTTVASVTDLTTTDTTPIISGELNAALKNGEYLTVTVNGKTYSSEKGGAVVVDPDNNTWYLQLSNFDALTVGSYKVETLVRSSAGNGNTTGAIEGNVTVVTEASMTPGWTVTNASDSYATGYMLDESGQWSFMSNRQIVSSTAGRNDYSVEHNITITSGAYSAGSFGDIDRDGFMDAFASSENWSWAGVFMNNANGTYTSSYLDLSRLAWRGAVVALDIQGDGFVDFVMGDAGGPDSNTFLLNNGGTLVENSGTGATFKAGDKVNGYNSLIEASGVDLNNDGRVDLAQHTALGTGSYSLTTLINKGNGDFVWGQNVTGIMNSGSGGGAISDAVSMTWADFNGDGFMDLYMGMTRSNKAGGLMLNDGSGTLKSLQAVGSATTDKYDGTVSVAVDWNHDGNMDIIKLANSGQSWLYANNGQAVFSAAKFGTASASRVAGAALVDYDWDGKQDLLIFRQNGKVELERNTNAVADGTALHLKIVDSQGINAYFGNTVRLFDSSGKLVASQVLNAQSGIGINDSSALLSFYGLTAGETYRAEMLYMVNGTSTTTEWGGLTAGDARDSYSLIAEAATGKHEGTLTGTGYNDTFIAQEGSYTYSGAGGWETSSEHDTWSATGGMDVVDYRNAASGITADLSKTTAQETGYNTSTFTNIEGIAGSAHDDVITGNSGNNQFEGRGGNDTFNIGSGGHDTLLYKLINAADPTGGNGHDVVNGFSVGTWEGTADSDRIDLRELLQGSGYDGNASASYVNGDATLDAGNLTDYLRVTTDGSNTVIQIDRSGGGDSFVDIVTLNGVQTDLATLLANHQLLV